MLVFKIITTIFVMFSLFCGVVALLCLILIGLEKLDDKASMGSKVAIGIKKILKVAGKVIEVLFLTFCGLLFLLVFFLIGCQIYEWLPF